MGTTDHYRLKRLASGEALSENGYQYTDADRALIDRILYLGAEGHRHSGAVAVAPTLAAPTLTLSALSGSLPAGTRVYYKYTQVDANGFESAPSTETFVDTPPPVAEPNAPVLVVGTAGGSLLPGQYFYVVTAYTLVNTRETKALSPAYVTVPVGTSTNRLSLTLPSLPAGATGFNIYRKKPGASRYDYLASTTGSLYIDTGAVAEDCNRTVPVRNSTNSANNVAVLIAALPAGSTWKLYRSYITGSYQNALVHWVVEQTFEGSGVITATYTDMGLATLTGTPPVLSQVVGSPDPISLTNMAEVRGALPMSAVSAFPAQANLEVTGALAAGVGTRLWVCEYPRASIRGVRASLGRGSLPAAQAVIVDVNVGHRPVPNMASLFTVSADQPRILVGEQVGSRVVPTARTELVEGDVVTMDIDQAGGGATPTDRDLLVSLYLHVYGYTSTVSFVAPTSPFTAIQIPDLWAWLKADAITGLADGATVAAWADASGEGHGVAQASAGLRPLYKTAILNAKPVVRFDGVDDYLRSAAIATISEPMTVVVVAKSAVSGNHTFVDGTNGGDMRVARIGTSSYTMADGAGLVSSTTPPDTAFHIFACTFAYGTNASFLRVGGGAGTSGNAGDPNPAGYTVGAHGALSGNFLNGDVAELVIYRGVLGLADLNALGGYLAAKYALTWTTAV